MPPSSPADWIAAASLPGLGPRALRDALRRFGSPAHVAHNAPIVELDSLVRGSLDAAAVDEARRGLRRRAARLWKQCERGGIRQLLEHDEDYPAALREIHDPPLVLYMRGELPPGRLRIAVVGSRQPTLYGSRMGTGLGQGLAARGVEVVSGGARGIDTCAHRGALAADGRTVAVLGSGMLCPYPAENRRLFDEIAERGAVLSELAPDAPPLASHFPQRNRLISGLAAAVVVVEAARKSGSLGTAGLALEQGREVMAVPGPVTSTRSEGTNMLIQQGAKLVQNVEDILVELPPLFVAGVPGHLDEAPGFDEADLTEDEGVVLRMIDPVQPVHVDSLAEQVPFGIARLQSALFGLETRGAVDPLPGRYYLLRPRKEP